MMVVVHSKELDVQGFSSNGAIQQALAADSPVSGLYS
jgi:hypothetical protein